MDIRTLKRLCSTHLFYWNCIKFLSHFFSFRFDAFIRKSSARTDPHIMHTHTHSMCWIETSSSTHHSYEERACNTKRWNEMSIQVASVAVFVRACMRAYMWCCDACTKSFSLRASTMKIEQFRLTFNFFDITKALKRRRWFYFFSSLLRFHFFHLFWIKGKQITNKNNNNNSTNYY